MAASHGAYIPCLPALPATWISLDPLASFCRDMLSEMQRQSRELQLLRATVDALPTMEAVSARFAAVASQVTALEARVASVEQHTAVPANTNGVDVGLSLGALASAAAARARAVDERVTAECVTHADLAAQLAQTQRAAASGLAQLKDACASREYVATLSTAADATNAQVAALQGLMATKVDRTELARLQSTATDLMSFATWKAAAHNDIRDLFTKADEGRAALDHTVGSLSDLSALVQRLAMTLQAKADSAIVVDVQHNVSDLQARVDACATTADHASMLQRMDALIQHLNDTHLAMNASEQRATSREAQMLDDVTAKIEELRTHLISSNDALRHELSALEQEAQAKAPADAFSATASNVAALEQTTAQLSRQVDVCLRFVEWFSEKGEAYEYNAAALERHMNALAVGNRSRVVGRASDIMTTGMAPRTGTEGVRIGGVYPVTASERGLMSAPPPSAPPAPRAAFLTASGSSGGSGGGGGGGGGGMVVGSPRDAAPRDTGTPSVRA